jgi:hypothetical protein
MFDTQLCEHLASWLYIYLLSDDAIYITDDPSRLDELISRPDTVDDELGILAIVVIPYSQCGSR